MTMPQQHLGTSGPFLRVDAQAAGVVQAPIRPEDTISLPITTGEFNNSLAIHNSILLDPVLSQQEEGWKWIYIIMWLPMHLVALYVTIKFLWYLWFTRPLNEEGRSKLLGPKKMTYLFDKAHPYGYRVRNGVMTSDALDVVYAIPLVLSKPRTLGGWVVWFWLNQPDAQGPRNRLRKTFHSLLSELERLYGEGRGRTTDGVIQILSLACGSAQATIEAVAVFLSRHPDAHLSLLLVDKDNISLESARRLAQHRKVDKYLEIKRERLNRFLLVEGRKNSKWDIIEMVGFLDYLKTDSVVKICKNIRHVLKSGGLFITAHINHSPWSFVVRWVTNWPALIRRFPGTFRTLLERAGFRREDIQIELEKSRTHTLAWCRKA